MSKQNALKIVNMVLALAFVSVAISAILNMFHLIPEQLYGVFHALPGLMMIICAVIHIILNRSWIKNAYFKKESKS